MTDKARKSQYPESAWIREITYLLIAIFVFSLYRNHTFQVFKYFSYLINYIFLTFTFLLNILSIPKCPFFFNFSSSFFYIFCWSGVFLITLDISRLFCCCCFTLYLPICLDFFKTYFSKCWHSPDFSISIKMFPNLSSFLIFFCSFTTLSYVSCTS